MVKVPEWVTDIQDKVGMNYEGAEIPADASTFPLILEDNYGYTQV